MLWRFGNKFRQTHVLYVTSIIIRVAVYPKSTSNHEVIQLFSLELPISHVKHRHIQTSTFLQIQGNIQAVRSTRNPLCSLTSRFLQRSPERKSRRWWSAMAEWFLNIRITKVGLFALVPICALSALPHRWRCQTLPYNFYTGILHLRSACILENHCVWTNAVLEMKFMYKCYIF